MHIIQVEGTHVLHGNQIRADEWYMINLAEHAHDARVIDTRDEYSK
jgi:hypothetical protein